MSGDGSRVYLALGLPGCEVDSASGAWTRQSFSKSTANRGDRVSLCADDPGDDAEACERWVGDLGSTCVAETREAGTGAVVREERAIEEGE